MRNDLFDGYSVIVKRVGHSCKASILEIPEVSVVTESSIDSIAELKINFEKHKKNCKKHNISLPAPLTKKEYTGQVNIRLNRDLHQAIALEAIKNKVSINSLIEKKLEQTTIIGNIKYQWKIDRVIFRLTNILLFFVDENNKKEVTLKISKNILDDTLGDANVESESILFKYIEKTNSLLQTFQKFISENISQEFTESDATIDCVLLSKKAFLVMGFILNEKFSVDADYYLFRVQN